MYLCWYRYNIFVIIIIVVVFITFMQGIYNYIPTIIYLKQPMCLGYVMLQLFCGYNSLSVVVVVAAAGV